MHNQSEAARRGAASRATLTSSERPNINIIALNIISCGEKFVFFVVFFFKWCRRDHWDIYHPWHTVVGQRNCNMDTRRPSVMNSLPQKTYLSRNTSHKVSFSCHCYISDTQQDSPDAHRQSVEMLRPLIHRNRKRKKMWKWVFGLHKRANWTNLMSEDASALTSVLSFRTVFGSLLEKLPLRFGIPTDC